MNIQFVLGTEAHGAADPSGTITKMKNIDKLKAGAYAFIVNGAEVLGDGKGLTPGDRVQLVSAISGLAADDLSQRLLFSVPIRRGAVESITRDKFTADVTAKYLVKTSTIDAGAEGEAVIVMRDLTYNRTIANNKVNISLIKKAGESISVFVDRLINKIKEKAAFYANGKAMLTVEKATNDIAITMADANVDFSISLDGILAGVAVTTERAAAPSLTNVRDILASEQEFSGNLGNGNYGTLGDAFWSFPQQTKLDTDYDVFYIKFAGEHDLPQNKVRAATLWLKIAVPKAQGNAFATKAEQAFGVTIKVTENGKTPAATGA